MVKWRYSQPLLLIGLCRQCKGLRRTFLQSAIDLHPTPKSLPTPAPGKPTPSMRASRKEGIKVTNLPQDLGLMDGEYELTTLRGMPSILHCKKLTTFVGTFIMPSGKNKPLLAREPRLRLRLELFRLKKRVMDFLG